jgi:segregation and condensation protein B
VSDAPVKARALADVVGEDISASDVRQAVRDLNQHYEETRRAYAIEELAGGYQMLTRTEFDGFVRQLQKTRARGRLSRAGLETLAIIAYKQPLTRPQIEDVRGVDAGGVLNTLLERGLCKIVGRAEGPGRPLLYGTTPQFMEHFGLRSLGQLPRIDDVVAALDRKLIAEDLAQELGGDPGEFDGPIRGLLDPAEPVEEPNEATDAHADEATDAHADEATDAHADEATDAHADEAAVAPDDGDADEVVSPPAVG